MNPDLPQRWRLAAGQTAHLPIAAGHELVVLSGRVRLDWPVEWMGEVALRHSAESGEGARWGFERAGWAAVRALGDAEISLQPRQGRAQPAQGTFIRKAQA